jgi:hypothetical protein
MTGDSEQLAGMRDFAFGCRRCLAGVISDTVPALQLVEAFDDGTAKTKCEGREANRERWRLFER